MTGKKSARDRRDRLTREPTVLRGAGRSKLQLARRELAHSRASPLLLPASIDWHRALNEGWTTDGASGWPDAICGVDCGSSGDHSYPPLPFPLHDFRWRRGGTKFEFGLSNVELRGYLRGWVLANRAPQVSERWCRFVVRLTYWGVRSGVGAWLWRRRTAKI